MKNVKLKLSALSMPSVKSTWKEIESFLYPFKTCKIFVGCSGGVDSMTLLHFLHMNGFSVHALHVNYHKRGNDSDADQQLVIDFCKQASIPHTTRDFKPISKGNFQEQARTFRYHFFEEMAYAENSYIALAHHADDQVETFCMNLMRKSGIVGLSGIPRTRKKFIRPFLNIPKQELVNYATNNQIQWREDSSNLEANYLRNKWRLEFLPIMEREVPEIRTSILEMVNFFQGTQLQLEQKAIPLARRIKSEQQITLDKINALTAEEHFELWRQLNQPSKLFHRLEELLSYDSGKQIEGHGNLKSIYKYKSTLHFEFKGPEIQIPKIERTIISELPETFSKNEIFLDPTKIHGSLKLRQWQNGDRISPIGIKGSQLVSKIIKDSNIPLINRPSIMVLHDDTQILWVVGLKVSRNAIADKSKRKHLKVSIS